MAKIIISGAVSVGKSIVMDTIEKALKEKFPEINIVSPDLEVERNGSRFDDLADWEVKMVTGEVWELSEVTTSD